MTFLNKKRGFKKRWLAKIERRKERRVARQADAERARREWEETQKRLNEQFARVEGIG